MKFELQFTVKIEPQSVLACFTHWVLPYHRVESGLSGLHKLHTTEFQANCHPLYGESGILLILRYYVDVAELDRAAFALEADPAGL